MSNPTRPVTDTVIDTAWGLAVADSVVRVYPNAASRDADLAGISSAELLGQVVVLTDTGALLVYAGPVMLWRPPWSMPWGLVAAPVVSTLDVTGTASPQSILSTKPSATFLAGRTYRATGIGCVLATAGAQLNLTGPTFTEIRGRVSATAGGEVSQMVLALWAQGTTQTAQTVDLQITGASIVSKGSSAPHRLVVEDIGPSANPTALVADGNGALMVDPDLLEPEYAALWADVAA